MASSLNNICVKRSLLIGNNRYSQGHRLEYCINNVNDVKDKLKKIDFHVTIGVDLNCDEIDTIIEDFVKEINPGDLIIFFYSGYGVHSNDQNYLVPIDDNEINNVEMFEPRAVNVKNLIDMIMNRRPCGGIFLFDCCRPYLISNQIILKNKIDYEGFIGLESITNCFIIYNCDKNQTILDKSINGRNNLFIYYLLEHIDQPNLSIDELMDIISEDIIDETNHEQIPFKIGSIKKNIYLNYQIQSEMSKTRKLLIEQIINQSQTENLSLVDLRYKQLIDRDLKIVVQKILETKQCTKLWLDGNRITSIGASILASGLNNNTSLERLYLHSNFISDIGIKHISKTLLNNNKTLKILGLQQNQITDLGIEYLSKMIISNKTLTGIWLDNNLITDKGVQILSNALQNSNSSLEYIDLSKNRSITDSSIDYILNIIKFNKSINELSLYDCNLSKTAKEKLRTASKLKKNFMIYLNSWDE